VIDSRRTRSPPPLPLPFDGDLTCQVAESVADLACLTRGDHCHQCFHGHTGREGRSSSLGSTSEAPVQGPCSSRPDFPSMTLCTLAFCRLCNTCSPGTWFCCAALACCCLCSTGMLLLVQHRNAPEQLCSTGLLVPLTWCILSVRSTGMLLVMQPEHWHAAACAAQACAACFLCSTGRCKTPHWQVSAVPYSPAACTSSQYKGAALVLRL
jgi:hypothetical protein